LEAVQYGEAIKYLWSGFHFTSVKSLSGTSLIKDVNEIILFESFDRFRRNLENMTYVTRVFQE